MSNINIIRQQIANHFAAVNALLESLEQANKVQRTLKRTNSFMARMDRFASIIKDLRAQGYSQATVAEHINSRFVNTTSNIELVSQIDISKWEIAQSKINL
jgi:hypothetical protein